MEQLYLQYYDPAKTYTAPSGAVMDAALVGKRFPAAARGVPYVMRTDPDGEMMLSMEPLSSLKMRCGVDPALTGDAALAAVREAMLAAQQAQDPTESTPEERIAAALELANVMNMPTVNGDDPDAE